MGMAENLSKPDVFPRQFLHITSFTIAHFIALCAFLRTAQYLS